MHIEIGQSAPNFTLQTDEGHFLSLQHLNGKKIVLYFYPKDDTSMCTQEACEFRDAWPKLMKANATVLGISRDTVKTHQLFKAKYNLPFSLLSDKEGIVCEQYGVLVDKKRFGKKYKGIERTTFLIDEKGDISVIWSKIKLEGHVSEVLNKVLQ